MAIYRKGQASMDADGYITGYDTEWKSSLALIRAGATIVFGTTPASYATISDIIDNTSMRAITTGGAVIERVDYVIMLHDSLTVDGLAQDVAETLRYYQSKETEFAQFVEFLKDFDWTKFEDLTNQAIAASKSSKQYRDEAEGFKDETAKLKDDTTTIKNQADSAKNDAYDARDEAELARDDAQTYKVEAESSKNQAKEFRDQAEGFATSIDPERFLTKENNLQDLADRAAAWLNVRPLGATPLAGDPVGDYDAATKRWVENLIGAGTTGPTMNGVMNYGVGKPLMHMSRAYIPPYELPLDGQIVKRSDWPELWAHAQQHGLVTDDEWVANPSSRGSYSSGDGSTTFRLPDWNGAQKAGSSIQDLYFSGTADSAKTKTIVDSSLPNIKGDMTFHGAAGANTFTVLQGAAGSFIPGVRGTRYGATTPTEGAGSLAGVNFDASRSSQVYGRRGNVNDVIPNTVYGVWVVRASGGFTAANTSWSVINGDESLPGSGVTVKGGKIVSEYRAAGAKAYSAELVSLAAIGQRFGFAVTIEDVKKGLKSEIFNVLDNGTMTVKDSFILSKTSPSSWKDANKGILFSTSSPIGGNYDSYIPHTQILHRANGWSLYGGIGFYSGGTGDANSAGMALICHDSGSYGRPYIFRNSGAFISGPSGDFLPAGTSDKNMKFDINYDAGAEFMALDNIKRMKPATFKFKFDKEKRERRGVISQDLLDIDKDYVHKGSRFIDDKEVEVLQLDNNSLLADALLAINALIKQVESLKSEIETLKKQ